MKYKSCIMFFILIFLNTSCRDKEFGAEDVVFLNYSPQTIIEITVYNTNRRVNGNDNKHEIIQTHAVNIKPFNYFVFSVPISSLPNERFYLDVRTEDGEISSGGYYTHWGIRYSKLYLSVDYQIWRSQ